jgi:NADPH2:quinone reductase
MPVIDHARADAGADRKVESCQPVALIASLTSTEQHYKALADVIAPQGKFGLIDDPAEFNISVFKGKAFRCIGSRCSPAHRSRRLT